MPLSPKQSELLAQMRADNRRAGPPFVTTEFWNDETARFEKLFQATGINDVENEYFNTRFSGLQPGDSKLYRWFLWMYYNAVKQRDTLDLLERIPVTLRQPEDDGPAVVRYKSGEPVLMSRLERMHGKPVSPDLLFSVDDFYNLCELDPRVATDEVVVADLGAGWGRLGYVLMQANPRARYVVLDIPETLLIASEHLPRLMKNCTVGDYAATRELANFDRYTLLGKQLWLLGCHDLPRFSAGSIDVMVNVASFQEMAADQANAYLTLFDHASLGGCVYLRNAWIGAMSGYRDLRIPEGWEPRFERDACATCDMYEAGFKVS